MTPKIPNWFLHLEPPLQQEPVWLENVAWPDAEKTLKDTLLLPVGATEQHGPHLPLSTDTLIATAACAYASAITGAPVLPALNYTVSLGHTEKWPGTFSIYHETLIHTVRSIAQWAAAAGWKRLLVVNSHFGNDAPLRCAVDRVRFDYPGEFFIATRNTWQLSQSLIDRFSADATDWHANEAETSLLLFIAPHLVQTDRIEDADDADRTGGCVFPHMVPYTSRNGVTGSPSLASAQRGSVLMREIGDELVAVVERARADETPLRWNRTTRAFGP